jgi:hypothetical protein
MYDEFMQAIADFIVEIGLAKHVEGCSEEVILELETKHNRTFPASYKAFLRKMGEFSGNWSEYGADCTIYDLREAQKTAHYLSKPPKHTWKMPEDMFPISQVANYEIHLLNCEGDDPPVYFYREFDDQLKQVNLSFTTWLRDRILGHLFDADLITRWVLQQSSGLDKQAQQFRNTLIERIHLEDQRRGKITDPKIFQEILVREFSATPIYARYQKHDWIPPFLWTIPTTQAKSNDTSST